MNKNSKPVQIFFLGVDGKTVPQLYFLQTSGINQNESRWEAHIRLQDNLGKANSRRYDVTRYIGGLSKDPQSTHCAKSNLRSNVLIQLN